MKVLLSGTNTKNSSMDYRRVFIVNSENDMHVVMGAMRELVHDGYVDVTLKVIS